MVIDRLEGGVFNFVTEVEKVEREVIEV